MDKALKDGLRIVFDLSFEQASQKDINSLAKQLGICNHYNKQIVTTGNGLGLSMSMTSYNRGPIVDRLDAQGGQS